MAEQKLSKQTKMAMASQFLGFMLDAYDMAMVLVMAPILVNVFLSPKGSAAWQYIVILFTYSITMAARPIGSAIFGAYADKIGRRFLLILTLGGVGVMSLLGGFLSTYAQIGVWSYVIFCVLRLLMGIFFGGVYVWWAHKIPFIAAIEKQDMWLSPAVILTIGAVMTFVSLSYSPETKHLQLNEVGERERASDWARDLAGVGDTMAAD